MIKILIIEDHSLIRDAWKEILSRIDTFQVVGESDDIEDAYKKTVQLKPDIILTDINLGKQNGVDLIKKIVETVAKPKIIVVSMNDEYNFIKKMFRLGIKGYVTKFSPQTDLIDGIRRVYNGENYLCSVITKLLLEISDQSKEETNNLSLRELDVLKLISQGNSNKEIADKLNLGVKTVEAHKTRLYKKLGVKSIAELITYGKSKGYDL
ncbi:response regulator transcription factor [Aurantibacillus circumpalustris]|uniref:response regulator transcription factor n=1 Tax=Aurantibacillus circumpalustris TaxID=3036359 RepID=UPI00295BFB63|nr:response regulator transcription factor [Aurantibacillus circumpalustris]